MDASEKKVTVIPAADSISEISDFFDACIEEFELPMKLGYKIKVIVDEIYSNIVYYSHASNAEVSFRNELDTVTMIFADDGTPYNPLESREPDITLGAEEREIGGLGLFMVKKMAEDVCYAHSDGKNRLTITVSKAIQKKKLTLEDF